MGYVDKDGNGVRYQGVYHNMYAEFPEFFPANPRLTGQGGGGGRGAGAGAGDGRGAGAGAGGAGNTPTPAGR